MGKKKRAKKRAKKKAEKNQNKAIRTLGVIHARMLEAIFESDSATTTTWEGGASVSAWKQVDGD